MKKKKMFLMKTQRININRYECLMNINDSLV